MDTTPARCVIVTGANTGLGYYCAMNIAAENKSWHVVLACRDHKKAMNAANRMISETANPNITFLPLDLSSFSSVRDFVKSFLQNKYPPLQAIVCNAGMAGSYSPLFTSDGIEATFQVNCLSHFLLIHLLLNSLRAPARILMVSSELHRNNGPMTSFRPHYTSAMDLAIPSPENPEKSSGRMRYSTSKLCLLMYTHEFAERLKNRGAKGITVNAFNPGLMPDTGLGGLKDKPVLRLFLKYVLPLWAKNAVSTPQRSGKVLARLVISEQYEGVTGKYFDRDKESAPSEESFDEKKRADLWNTSVYLTKVEDKL